ncbi:hypothetical protein GCM10010421_58760 [Streptomyces glaucus]|uniref:Secreted protein n=1 Tax=Streptomyces glaucus TaxID=284029 RepID=A0ABP5XPQ6_9ACTN
MRHRPVAALALLPCLPHVVRVTDHVNRLPEDRPRMRPARPSGRNPPGPLRTARPRGAPGEGAREPDGERREPDDEPRPW